MARDGCCGKTNLRGTGEKLTGDGSSGQITETGEWAQPRLKDASNRQRTATYYLYPVAAIAGLLLLIILAAV